MKSFLRHPLTIRILAALLANYVRLVYFTSRVQVVTAIPESFTKGPVMLAGWHQQISMLPVIVRPSPSHILALMSGSRDGIFMRATAKWFNIKAGVGSSHRGGSAGARALVQAARTGHTLFISPDGPRGPAHIAKPGVTEIARLTRLPVIPVAAWPTHAKAFGSWDKLLLPYPFTTIRVAYGTPLQTLTPQALQAELNTLTTQAQGKPTPLVTPSSKL